MTNASQSAPGRDLPTAEGDVVARVERVAVLHDLAILDTPPEAAYDDLASLAAVVCRSEIAAVNFVDQERHWTKAIVGVEGGQGGSVPEDVSLCAATIRSADGIMTIGNTLAEDRWREHPFVSGAPGIRFYAGASIVVSGERVGVVCVFGDEPGEFSDAEGGCPRGTRPSGVREPRAARAQLGATRARDH